MTSGSEREIFDRTGPSFLTSVDWSNSHHRRSVAASLVQGVYTLERDRLRSRQGPQALAPPWWEFFNFKLYQVLVDDHDLSCFGAVYEFNFPYHHHNYSGPRPPHYVIAFRGTINKPGSRAQDLKLDLHCILNNLHGSRRFQIGMEVVSNIVSKVGPENVWVAGHSLGSSIVLVIGRQTATENGTHLESYLFNPPFASAPIERIKNEKVKLGLRFANSFVTAGLALAANSGTKKKGEENDHFTVLSSWIPYLFVNPSDPICAEYVGYFEHREKMVSIGAGKIGKLATKHSVGSILASVVGKGSADAAHLIPSAYLSIVNSTSSQDFKQAHGIHQWWNQDLEFRYKLYQYK